jgi:hypothetical protein
MKTALKYMIAWTCFLVVTKASVAAIPPRLQLPVDGKAFFAHSLEFDHSGERICITGSKLDDMGNLNRPGFCGGSNV